MDVVLQNRSNWQRESNPRRSCCKNSSLCFPSFSDDNGAIRSKITFEQFNLAIKFKSHFSRHIPPSTALPGGFSTPHCQRERKRGTERESLFTKDLRRQNRVVNSCSTSHDCCCPVGLGRVVRSRPLSFLHFKEYYARYSAIMLRWRKTRSIFSQTFIFPATLVSNDLLVKNLLLMRHAQRGVQGLAFFCDPLRANYTGPRKKGRREDNGDESGDIILPSITST